MAITYVIKFNVRAEQRVEFLKLLNDVLDAMRHEPMFHEAILHQDPENENRFMLYETWEDHEDVLEVQLHRPYRKAWHDALPTHHRRTGYRYMATHARRSCGTSPISGWAVSYSAAS